MDIEQALADIPHEGVEDPTETMETETPSDTPSEEKPVAEQPAEEGDNTPTEEDEGYKERTSKRMKQILEERAEERMKREELEAELAVLRGRDTQQKTVEEIPDRWLKLYSTGDEYQDQQAFQEWKALNEEQRQVMKEEILADIQAQEQEKAKETEQFAQAYEDAMDDLEAEGKKFDRNELMKAMAERPIFRHDGTPDFATTLELLEAKKQPDSAKIQARKSIATINKQGGEATPWKTPADLRGGFSSI